MNAASGSSARPRSDAARPPGAVVRSDPGRAVARLLALCLLLPIPSADAETDCQAGDPGVQPPRPAAGRVEPEYPDEARAAGIQGRVILRVLVDASGAVEEVEAVRAPYRGEALKEAAVTAVRRWRYEPAVRDGEPLACWVTASLEFYPSPGAPAPRREEPSSRKRSRSPEPTPPPARGGPPPGPPGGRVESPPTGADVPPPRAGEGAGRPAAPPPPAVPSPRVIEPERGGPVPLVLGASAESAGQALSNAARMERGTETLLRSVEAGLEVILGANGRVRRIRYVFDDPTGTFETCEWRTRTGLGARSSCMGIPPAHGRPEERLDATTEEGRAVSSLVYRGDQGRFTFRCAGGRLVELVVETD